MPRMFCKSPSSHFLFFFSLFQNPLAATWGVDLLTEVKVRIRFFSFSFHFSPPFFLKRNKKHKTKRLFFFLNSGATVHAWGHHVE